MNVKMFRVAATPEVAAELEAMRQALEFQTYAQLFEWAVGVGRAIMEAQEKHGVVQIVYTRRRWWWPFWTTKEIYYLDVTPEHGARASNG